MPACLGMEVVLTWHAIAFAMAATPSNGGGSGLHSPSMALWDIKKGYMVCCLWTRCCQQFWRQDFYRAFRILLELSRGL